MIMAILLAIPASIANAYALSVVWGWFIVSTFGLPEISIPVALGIALIATILKSNSGNSTEFNEELFVKIITATITPFMYIGIGYVYLQFI